MGYISWDFFNLHFAFPIILSKFAARYFNKKTMLRKIRISLAILFWVLITWLFVDFTGTAQAYLGWMARMQFVPALLALNGVALLLVAVLTLVLGRIYCSVICPLGVMQDVIAWFRKKKYKYTYSPAKNKLRYIILLVWILILVVNLGWLAGQIEPYSLYGRIVTTIASPLYKIGNNVLAQASEHYDNYTFYSVDVWLKSGLTLAVSFVFWIIIAILAWRGGRTWCNTICPVGSILGLISRHSIYGPVIDLEKCNNCGLCARSCKASCIDSKNHQIDMSRCVTCGDCMEHCHQNAMQFGKRIAISGPIRQPDTERRAMLTGTALLAGSALLKAEEKTVDGGFAAIEKKIKPEREKLITPPGSISARHMTTHCTACQLCINACPNNVLRPSTSFDRLMQPEVSYERGYCRPECNICSQVCPTSAILPIEVEERAETQVGVAKWVRENCISAQGTDHCDLCARKCPFGAIQMVPLDGNNEKKVPVVNEEKCIGCGACENLCPSRPFSALYVEGNHVHHKI